MRVPCPVCRKEIALWPAALTLRAHSDKAQNHCPMSGQPVAVVA